MSTQLRLYYILILLSILLFVACGKNDDFANHETKIFEIPEGFPAVNFPDGNEFTLQRWALGKRLFYDPIMSVNNTISCASCHLQENAFSDTIAFSLGDNNTIGRSNVPTLTNVAYNPYYTRAGGVPTLEMQILVPIQEHDEFNTNILDIVEKLKHDESYVKQAQEAYSREIDPFVITRSLANFERSLLSGNSAFDQFTNQGKQMALSVAQQRGKELFMSARTNCSQCHSGFNFTNYAFENNGLYLNYADSGRMRLTRLESDRALFKVPTLRNVEMTAPYMHDGSIKTIEDVVKHYNSGGVAHPHKSVLIKPLNLSTEEQNNLVAFLKSLTDYQFLHSKHFKNEK